MTDCNSIEELTMFRNLGPLPKDMPFESTDIYEHLITMQRLNIDFTNLATICSICCKNIKKMRRKDLTFRQRRLQFKYETNKLVGAEERIALVGRYYNVIVYWSHT